ncbi:hypothetical protein Goklo_016229 [Gossypium klotzschianum]|uniref:Flavodoxin-like domain-containing protein n=1 Tax=Gossypium klotzschianum TaxID=34286 RepID=A0A7J8UE11_9ROSI|nr:hypothetical protein [Gossypium klotzschianum]
MLLFYGFFSGILIWVSAADWGYAAADKWKIFYMYSKAIHGELAGEIAEEFAREYVSLPFDDGKVPHVVSVVYG